MGLQDTEDSGSALQVSATHASPPSFQATSTSVSIWRAKQTSRSSNGGFRERSLQRYPIYGVLDGPQKTSCLLVFGRGIFFDVLQRPVIDQGEYQPRQRCRIGCHASGRTATTSRKYERTFFQRDSRRNIFDSINGRVRKCASQFCVLPSRLCQAPK